MSNNVKCPSCGADIELSEALTGQIEQDIKARYQEQAAKQNQELHQQKKLLEKQADELATKQAAIEEQVSDRLKEERKKIIETERNKVIAEQEESNRALQQELTEKTSKLSEANKKELELLKQQKELQEKTENIELEVQRKIAEERKKITDEASKKATEELELKMKEKDELIESIQKQQEQIAETERKKILAEQAEANKAIQDELAEKTKKLTEANKKELDLLKKQQELEEKSENIDLEVQRKISEQRKKIAMEATEKATEEQMLKIREKDDLIKAMQEQVENLKRRADLGSQEAQGEALEGELKDLLEREFPFDQIEEVKKGARGADVVQVVHNSSGKECGKILWESKNTKDFQKPWIEKLKKDQQQTQADIAILMTIAMPSGIKSFGLYEGVWTTDYKSATGLALALRQGIIEANRQRIITAGRNSIKDVVYNYITSQEFSMHISSVMNSYKQMQEDLESEKRAMARIWKRREKQITTVLDNVSGMYGSIEGIVGTQKALPSMGVMELDSIAED